MGLKAYMNSDITLETVAIYFLSNLLSEQEAPCTYCAPEYNGPPFWQIGQGQVKVRGHVSLQHLVQLMTQECFAKEASNLVGRYFDSPWWVDDPYWYSGQ